MKQVLTIHCFILCTYLTSMANLPPSLTCMYLYSWREPTYPKEIHTDTRRTCKCHTENPSQGSNQETSHLHHCGVQAYTTLYSQAVSHPSINQSRPCSVSKIRSEIRHAQDAVVINQLFHCALFYCNNLSAVLGHIGNCAKLGLYNHTVLNISKLQWERSNSSGHRSQKLEQAN